MTVFRFDHFRVLFTAAAVLTGAGLTVPAAAQSAPAPSDPSTLLNALPSTSEGAGREIFESASAASEAMDRHIANDRSSIWGEIMVRGAEQEPFDASAAGYDSSQTIITAGGDFKLSDDVRLGLIGSYADISVDDTSRRASVGDAEIESIKLGVYTAIELFDRGFFNAEVAYLTGNVETERAGFSGPIASAFDFDGIMGRAAIGYDLLEDENIWIVPTIGLNVANINFDDTTETGGLGLTVERGDAEFVELRGGIEFGAEISDDVTGFVKGTIIHDTVNTVRSFRVSSSQVSPRLIEFPLRGQDRFEFAAGLTAQLSETVAIAAGYQGDFNENYKAHAARLTVRIGF
ncbi:autotransporter outer membrane beta-barrel domain-containing protein [Erythrobacter insulae]|uniref:Autotransporter outer membrane beta-barrel domain-containing protein n=1 Tax=Erythrobacter insulae TaxID=2584124 RepID=A0A547P957_9SPHN|nr:autotransporter outer membrane beta-barrel domain-containing protein [Erythrobacter insulae]TRD10682.1 autotransporter outer membrane beta-barrel domain-containing protein [Erythrobacter insulae]